MKIQAFNSLYGILWISPKIRIQRMFLSIPFMGYNGVKLSGNFQSHYFQFPLWDTKISLWLWLFYLGLSIPFMGYKRKNNLKKLEIKWTFNSLYGILTSKLFKHTTAYSLSIPFMGYGKQKVEKWNKNVELSIPFMGYN